MVAGLSGLLLVTSSELSNTRPLPVLGARKPEEQPKNNNRKHKIDYGLELTITPTH